MDTISTSSQPPRIALLPPRTPEECLASVRLVDAHNAKFHGLCEGIFLGIQHVKNVGASGREWVSAGDREGMQAVFAEVCERHGAMVCPHDPAWGADARGAHALPLSADLGAARSHATGIQFIAEGVFADTLLRMNARAPNPSVCVPFHLNGFVHTPNACTPVLYADGGFKPPPRVEPNSVEYWKQKDAVDRRWPTVRGLGQTERQRRLGEATGCEQVASSGNMELGYPRSARSELPSERLAVFDQACAKSGIEDCSTHASEARYKSVCGATYRFGTPEQDDATLAFRLVQAAAVGLGGGPDPIVIGIASRGDGLFERLYNELDSQIGVPRSWRDR